eukprot:334702_1
MSNDTIVSITDVCSLPGITGSCSSLIDRWYYNTHDSECKYFTWSGCGGNNNNFKTLQLCQETCTDINSTTDNTFTNYHIVGFVMIFIVICIFFILYYLSTKEENKSLEPHQYKIVIKDINNKYNKRGCLYVSNIAKKVYQSDIKQLFEDYGHIIEFDFKETRGDQLNICFVQFKSIENAKKAMNELNGITIEQHILCIKPGSEYKPTTNPIISNKKLNTNTIKTHNKINKLNTKKKNTIKHSENNEGEILKTIETIANLDEVTNVKIEAKIDINMDIDAIIKNKNKFIQENPISPSENIYSTSMSMHHVDSDFQYYEDDNNDGIQMSDSDLIDLADNQQISALKQFVAKKK